MIEPSRRLTKWNGMPLAFAAVLILAAGCSLLPTIAYVIKPEDVPAEFDGLNGKRVAVICRSTALEYTDPAAARDLGIRVGDLLSKRGKKIQIVDERELADWIDNNGWNDYREVGKAMKADYVVGIDLERFETEQGATLLQGNAEARMAVYDIHKNAKVYEPRSRIRCKTPPESRSERNDEEFRRYFLAVVSEQIAQRFYDHDSRQTFAKDANALRD